MTARANREGKRIAWVRRRDNPDTRRELLHAAAVAFARDGYEGTSLGSIARAVGITAPSVYNHFSSKNEILFTCLEDYATLVMDRCVSAVWAAGADPARRLQAFVFAHVSTDLEHLDIVPLVNTYFQHGTGATRALNSAQVEALTQRQRSLVDLVRDIIADGQTLRVFQVPSVTTATFSVLGSISNVVYWFRPGGALDPRAVAEQLAGYALSSLSTSPGQD